MKGNIEERCIQLGQYIIEHSATVRAAAKKFDISKSTVHTDVSKLNIPPGIVSACGRPEQAT